ncbi:MAG: zinc-ribbon and FHA domain-containing protein [Actinomycetota bacterium]|jgi:pSer/pThr/pTyr-binding forkhead associated (FHA) protein|nr:zinc-ribbon and FHA domain-containing protein [Actinomycetota bacterium]
MNCRHCGHENPADANFCGNCGRPLASTGDTTTGALKVEDVEPSEANEAGVDVGELEAGTALLVGVRGSNRGARFLLDRDVVSVGRHPDSDIFLDDITVSRRHAEFRRDAQRFWVHDVGSLNGTYVNGNRADDQLLSTGDEVQIGKFKLVAFLAEPAD